MNRNLNLKKAAKAVGEKSVEMIPQKDLLPLTGYVHGGCSPIGMKKPFRTVIDAVDPTIPAGICVAGEETFLVPPMARAIAAKRLAGGRHHGGPSEGPRV